MIDGDGDGDGHGHGDDDDRDDALVHPRTAHHHVTSSTSAQRRLIAAGNIRCALRSTCPRNLSNDDNTNTHDKMGTLLLLLRCCFWMVSVS